MMSKAKKFQSRYFWAAVCSLAALAGVLLCQIVFAPLTTIRQKSVVSKNPPLSSSLSVALEGKSVLRARHDEQYWPQFARPVVLQSRTLTLSIDIDLLEQEHISLDEKLTWMVQFGGPIEAADRERLSKCGIDVLLPSVDMAWHVRATARSLLEHPRTRHPAILGWSRLKPTDKLLPTVRHRLARSEISEREGVVEEPSLLCARLELYPDTHSNSMGTPFIPPDLPKELGVVVLQRGQGFFEVRSIQPRLSSEFFLALAAWEAVYAVGLPRARMQVCNADAANHNAITSSRSAPRNLTGAGINVMVRDESSVFAHPDFGSRLTLDPDVTALTPSQHSSHVAGTIGGSGSVNLLGVGMAPNCQLIAYELNGDDYNEPLSAKTSYNAILSNHSYGFVTGWDGGTFTDNQVTFGQYGAFARNWDVLVLAEGLIIVKAVGNDRNDTGTAHPHDGTLFSDGEYYDTVDESSTGKNILVVGAAADSAQAGFSTTATHVLNSSSSGPCKDGRVRPELIANGDGVLSCNNSNAVASSYVTLSGTSMAAAVVSGATALFLERYQQIFGVASFPSPHYLRAVYAQTATDLGRVGPDYLHGFGLLDLNAALTLFETDNGSEKYILKGVSSATVPERFYTLTSDGITPIQATLCWTDEPGDALATKSLVNDLDLRLIRASDQSVTLPFVLNRLNPDQTATLAVNTVDTLEQVRLAAPPAGQYLLAVKGSKLSTQTNFVLASSHSLTENLSPICVLVSSATTGPPPLTITFNGLGSVDPDGSIVQYVWDFGDGTTGFGSTVLHTFSAGIFSVKLTLVDNGGASASSTISVGVVNQVPKAVASASPDSGLSPLSLAFSALGSSDFDGSIVKYIWDFGDGTSGSGSNLTHTFVTSGFYFATLIVTDESGATAKTQVGVLVGKTFTPQSSQLKLNFKRDGNDKFTLSTKSLPCDPALNAAGLSGEIRIGTLVYGFTLDAKGKYKAAPLTIQFVPSKRSFKVTLNQASLAGTVASLGARDDTLKNSPVVIPFALSFSDGSVYGFTRLIYNYSSKRGVSGTASFRP